MPPSADPHTVRYILSLLKDLESRAQVAGHREIVHWLALACIEAADVLVRAEEGRSAD